MFHSQSCVVEEAKEEDKQVHLPWFGVEAENQFGQKWSSVDSFSNENMSIKNEILSSDLL